MLNNKKKDMTPFDMKKPPMQQKWYLMPLIWAGSWIMTRQFKLKINKKNMSGIKPPYLVISTHQGFSDYYITPLALFPHRANYVSDMEGFAAFGEWLYRAIGCIGKRRYVSDANVVRNIKYSLDRGRIVVVYPESRHSNIGTTSYIPPNMGKLVKLMKVSLVILSNNGSYLANPFWDEEHTRKTLMETTIECVYTAEEAAKLSAEEIQRTIEERLQYDEYKWQQERNIIIDEPKRAEGLHKALYQCPKCKTEFRMRSEGTKLYCGQCHAAWELTTRGYLEGEPASISHKSGIIHIPDWYEWQRSNVIEEIEADKYSKQFNVRIEALPNAKGFVPLGGGILTHNKEGFNLTYNEKELFFDHSSRESVQTEYNYRGRGACIVLSDRDCCYYIYSENENFNPTRIQFAGEYFHQLGRN